MVYSSTSSASTTGQLCDARDARGSSGLPWFLFTLYGSSVALYFSALAVDDSVTSAVTAARSIDVGELARPRAPQESMLGGELGR